MDYIIPIAIIVFVLYYSYKSTLNKERIKANIEQKRKFVTSFSPTARIIVNNGDYLFFVDDVKQVFGADDSGTTYSYSGLNSIVENDSSGCIILYHDDFASMFGLTIGKSIFSDNNTTALDGSSILAIHNAVFPIIRKNVHEKLMSLNITPTYEYVIGGDIWGCDINAKMFYNTGVTLNIYPFSKLLEVTSYDVRNNPNIKCNYSIMITIKGDNDCGDDNEYLYFDNETTFNNFLAMFQCIKDRPNNFDISDKQRNFDIMEGHEFEYFCAGLLKKNGYENISVTQGSGDQGIDIIAYRDGINTEFNANAILLT